MFNNEFLTVKFYIKWNADLQLWKSFEEGGNIDLYLYLDTHKCLGDSFSCIGSWERQSPLEQKKKE